MKRIFSFALTLALVMVFFCGCDGVKELKVGCAEFRNGSGFGMSYELYTGEREYKIEVKDQPVALKIEIVTESGDFALFVGRDGFESDYTGNELETASFTVTLSETGTYKVKVTAKKHKGSFSVKY